MNPQNPKPTNPNPGQKNPGGKGEPTRSNPEPTRSNPQSPQNPSKTDERKRPSSGEGGDQRRNVTPPAPRYGDTEPGDPRHLDTEAETVEDSDSPEDQKV